MDDGGQSEGSFSMDASTSFQQQQSETGSRTGSGSGPPPLVLCPYGQRLGFAYFTSSPTPDASQLNRNEHNIHFFTIDNALVYLSFFKDWGPLHCASFYRFSLHLHSLLEDANLVDKRIVLYSSVEHDKKANAALLMALYAMIVLRWTPAEAIHPISELELRPFRDAGYARADFHLSLQDCLFGIKKAVDLRLLKLDEFDVREYETYEKVENGDWNLITPHFLAFASPIEPGYSAAATETMSPGRTSASSAPADLKSLPKTFRLVIEQFQAKNVKTIIRLNKKLYNAKHFTDRKMKHVEMFYEDGTNPTLDQVREFIDLAEDTINENGVVAVHCKAGLGRTGTLIGAYMIYKWGFTANEAIAFQRFMRPGCVVGPQQHFLYANQHIWVKWAALDSVKRSTTPLTQPVASTSATTVEAPSLSARSGSADQDRASTPPPQTEGHPSAPVPGQPRKTPGAKSRHGIALPETNDDTQGEPEAIMVASASQGTAAPNEPLQEENSGMELDDNDVEEEKLAPPPSAAPASPVKTATSPASHTRQQQQQQQQQQPQQEKQSSRPGSRIAKAKSPLTTNLDNRPATAASNHSSRSAQSVPRSKAARNLGVLSDSKPSLPSTAATSDRYNLRQASRGNAGDVPPTKTAPPAAAATRTAARSTRPAPPAHGGAQSPSRLPTARSGAKRKGAISPSQPAGRSAVHDVFTADQGQQQHQHQQSSQTTQNGNKMTRLRKKSIKATENSNHKPVRAAA